MANSKNDPLSAARERLVAFVPDAVELLLALAMTAENEQVQLKALEQVLDRGGLSRQVALNVSVDERERQQVRNEAEDVLARLERNRTALPGPTVSIEALVVHEGDGEELPVAVVPAGRVIDVQEHAVPAQDT